MTCSMLAHTHNIGPTGGRSGDRDENLFDLCTLRTCCQVGPTQEHRQGVGLPGVPISAGQSRFILRGSSL